MSCCNRVFRDKQIPIVALQYRKRYELLQQNNTFTTIIIDTSKLQYRKRYELLQPTPTIGIKTGLPSLQYRKRYELLQQCLT